jgi:hypothetical protein
VNANIELLKLLGDNGHLDTFNADIEDLIRRVRGDAGPGLALGEQHAELTDGEPPAPPEPESDNDD